jgi:hypothetical protein
MSVLRTVYRGAVRGEIIAAVEDRVPHEAGGHVMIEDRRYLIYAVDDPVVKNPDREISYTRVIYTVHVA